MESCEFWVFARHWRETLMHAYNIFRRIPKDELMSQTEFIDECQRLLVKYKRLMDMLEEIQHTAKPACTKFWNGIVVPMNWGLDVLNDLALYGKIEEKGKKAAFKRMMMILHTQKTRAFPEALIKKHRQQYEKNWFEHPRLPFEIPKAFLHEMCIQLLSSSRADGCLCPQMADYFAFTRWLGQQDYKKYVYYKQFPETRECSSCEYEKMTFVDRKKLYDAYEWEADHPLVSLHEPETDITGQSHHIRWFFIQHVLGIHLDPGDLILDLGCWNAGQTVNYAKLAEVIGVEISFGKLRQAGKHPHIRFVQGDWDHLPLKRESVDWCIWDEGPEHAVNPDHVLNEIAYVIRKGVILGTPLAPDGAVALTYKYLRGETQQWSGGHLHEFTKEIITDLISKHFEVETVYTLKHRFPGYTWLVGVGVKST